MFKFRAKNSKVGGIETLTRVFFITYFILLDVVRVLKTRHFYYKINDFTHRIKLYPVEWGYGRGRSDVTLAPLLQPYMDTAMIETLLQAIMEQLDQPKKDVEHNLRALLNEAVSKMDLVSKDEIERQRTALNNANLRLNELLKQVETLEIKIKNNK